jgi:hypothetical protein
MSSTRFEPKGSSSGRRLCTQLPYIAVYMQQYKQSSRLKSLFDIEQTIYNRLPDDEP